MRACRHRNRSDFLRVETALLGFAANEAHGTLGVFPCRLIDGQSLGARCAIHEIHALNALAGEALTPLLYKVHIAAALVSAARNQNHARIGANALVGSRHPFNVSHAVLFGLEILASGSIGHSSNLMSLTVRHFSFWPHGFNIGSRAV